MPTYCCADFPIVKTKNGPQVRSDLGDLTGLIASIKEHGVQQPIAIMEDGTVITGHRRLEASKQTGKTTIPAMIHAMLDALTVKLMRLTENLQRADMDERDIFRSCLELEAEGVSRSDIAKGLGKSPASVTRYLSPKECAPDALEAFLAGKLTLGQMDKIRTSTQPRDLMGLFLNGETQERAARKAKPKDAVRVEKVKIPLPTGNVVVVSGDGVSLEDAIEAMDEAKKAISAAIKRGLNSKTAQQVFKDVAAAR